MYRLNSPGNYLNTVDTWNEGLQKLGGENTAYWPNQVVPVPPEVRFITSTYIFPSSYASAKIRLGFSVTLDWNLFGFRSNHAPIFSRIFIFFEYNGCRDVQCTHKEVAPKFSDIWTLPTLAKVAANIFLWLSPKVRSLYFEKHRSRQGEQLKGIDNKTFLRTCITDFQLTLKKDCLDLWIVSFLL